MASQAQYEVVEQEVSVNDGQGTHTHSSGAGCNHTKPRIILRHWTWNIMDSYVIITWPKVSARVSQPPDLPLRTPYRLENKKYPLQTSVDHVLK